MIGLTLGTMLTGSIALASGTQIEVAYRNLKYMFDGVEKKPTEGQGFIYQGNTYVPLRFVSEALSKEVQWNEANVKLMVRNTVLDQQANDDLKNKASDQTKETMDQIKAS